MDLPTTKTQWAYEFINKLGFPIFLIVVIWFRLIEPELERYSKERDEDQALQRASVEIDRQQADLLKEIRSGQSEEIVRNRETVQLLKEIKAGMP